MTVEEYYSSPDRWCQGAFRRDKFGEPVDEGPDVACRCLVGALQFCYPGAELVDVGGPFHRLYKVLTSRYMFGSLLSFNDDAETKFEDVLELVKEAEV